MEVDYFRVFFVGDVKFYVFSSYSDVHERNSEMYSNRRKITSYNSCCNLKANYTFFNAKFLLEMQKNRGITLLLEIF